ncbi:hypothetical protein Y032_0014g2391 [Ancylostoma ceylanicum]|uniref:Uncharacterized protein n=1 Tax=Ancylostoma ceylanicum TaxID=53326 RepID=A0A016VAD3_9BILA|nr:hypothetical protein Y032_0014g2391 [Ancylostoma ceylanicum]
MYPPIDDDRSPLPIPVFPEYNDRYIIRKITIPGKYYFFLARSTNGAIPRLSMQAKNEKSQNHQNTESQSRQSTESHTWQGRLLGLESVSGLVVGTSKVQLNFSDYVKICINKYLTFPILLIH